MGSTNPLEAMVESAKAGRLAIFCGAGVSMLAPSRSPSWWEIYVAAATALRERFREGFPEITAEIDLDALLKPLQTQQLADLVVSQFAGGTFVQNLQVVDIADPNENHALIVALAAQGYVRGVVTTNWDTLLERTAAIRGMSFAVVGPAMQAQRPAASSPPLIKLHGSAVVALRLIETSTHKAREIDPRLSASWRTMVAEADLLVVGYSGADLNFGAARAFFEDFLASGKQFWWLHLPGFEPQLPENVRPRVTLLEGTLPEFLRDVAKAAGVAGFSTPVAGRDAQLALRQTMDAWSREIHIGRWSAAVFFQALGSQEGAGFRKSLLGQALWDLARKTAAQLQAGSELRIEDLSAGGFLSMSGLEALKRVASEDAVAMLRAAVNIFETINKDLDDVGEGARRSESERHMNLSSSWSNYGQALLMESRAKGEILQAFFQSMRHAYLGGHAHSFLIALANIIHYGFESSEVRRCMRMLQGGIRVADRVGSVQSSIEMRVHLAGFHIDRNEVHAAALELAEARRRAAAVFNTQMLSVIAILEGHILLKRGKIREGLAAIAEVVGALPHHAFVLKPVDEVRSYLHTIGIPQKGRFIIDLEREKVPEIAARVEAEIASAKANQTLPWKGGHCSVSSSSGFDDKYLNGLFALGAAEFEGDAGKAAGIGLHFASEFLNGGYFFDAYWVAKNVAANSDARPGQRAWAHSFLAHACAELGDLDAVSRYLEEAERFFTESGEVLPIHTVEVGMWHSIQSGDVAAAVGWARKISDAVGESKQSLGFCVEQAAKVDTWGDVMAPVGQALRETVLAAAGFALPARSATSASPDPFRRFAGTSAELQAKFHPKANQVLNEAQKALSEEDPEKALKLIDGLAAETPDGLPDHFAGIAAALQIQALGGKAPPAKLNKVMDSQRARMLQRMAFAALSRLEAAMARVAVANGDPLLAADILEKRVFIAELADDPRAKTSLLFWEAQIPSFRGGDPTPGKRARLAQLAVRYYRTAEAQLLEDEPKPADAGAAGESAARGLEARKKFLDIVHKSKDSAEVDAALSEALQQSTTGAAVMRGERANWALRMKRYQEAMQLFRAVQQEFRSAGDLDAALNAMAGESRALSRSGKHEEGVALFEAAIKESGNLPIRPNLLAGLAASHLLEATERRDPVDVSLLNRAIETYRQAVDAAPINDQNRAHARLGLARALGEKGEQTAAMEELDRAIAELAHIGSTAAKILMENRSAFEEGEWRALGLS